ncbi:LacI family DNA-binding transcriptional regulator, partial [Acinetobacter baumannii]
AIDRPLAAPARLKDVAEHAGVHISTASRALDPLKERRISPDVAAKVKASAQALGYQGNVIAASLRRRRSHTVGVVVPDLTNPMFPPMFRG